MIKMQNIYKCYNYTPNDNLNKTCENKKRCLLISYEQYCSEFTEKNNKKSQEKSQTNFEAIKEMNIDEFANWIRHECLLSHFNQIVLSEVDLKKWLEKEVN